MLKAAVIVILVIAVALGGLLAVRSSSRAGMPGEEVLKRAAQRARELDAAEKKDGD